MEEIRDSKTGETFASYTYDAFGNLLTSQKPDSAFSNSVTYRGYEYDSDTGLYYLNARYYDSETARFLSEDTYRGTKEDPLSLHLYAYCAGNPLRYSDPSGHEITGHNATFQGKQKVVLGYSLGGYEYYFGFHPGDTAPEIEKLNETLLKLGYLDKSDYDSYDHRFFSTGTYYALLKFQTDYNLTPSGICEQQSYKIIEYIHSIGGWATDWETHKRKVDLPPMVDRINKIKSQYDVPINIDRIWKRPNYVIIDYSDYVNKWNEIKRRTIVMVLNTADLLGVPFTGTIADFMSDAPLYQKLIDAASDIVWGAGIVMWVKGVKRTYKAVDAIDNIADISKTTDKIGDGADAVKHLDNIGDVSKGGFNSSKYMEQLDNFSQIKVDHMINGSKNSNHGREKLVPDKNWNDIKSIVNNVMENGVEGPYKSVFSKKMTINGYEVEVTYNKLADGTIKISDAWINP